MNSLSELNAFGVTSINVTDNRLAKVKFDRVTPLLPLDQSAQRSTLTITVNPGINIVEIIKYATANVRLRVRTIKGDTDPITSSTVAWTSLPSGVTLTTGTNVYTLSGINTVAAWEAVKSFSWTVSSDYTSKPLWFLNIAIVYYDEELGTDVDVDFNAYDPDNYYVASLKSTATMITNNIRNVFTSAALTSNFSVIADTKPIRLASANINCSTSLTASALDLDLAASTLSSSFTQSATVRASKTTSKNLSVVATVNAVVTAVKAIDNMTVVRTYQSNRANSIFTSNTPIIADLDGTSASYTIEFVASTGEFGTTSTSSSTYSFSGTKAQVNSHFSNIIYYPNRNVTSSFTATYNQYKNGSLQLTRTFGMQFSSLGAIATNTYVFTSSSTFTPSYEQRKYGYADVLVVGGGGSGAYRYVSGSIFDGGGGGGGGQALYNPSLEISNSSYTITVGNGGTAPTSLGQNGNNGSASSAFGYTGNPGLAGISGSAGLPAGGASGSGNAGGSGYRDAPASGGEAYGGSGGGATGAGSNWTGSTPATGGAGFTSTISGSSVTYGVGGGGSRGESDAGGITGTTNGNPGSGSAGMGGSPTFATAPVDGKAGIVIIRVHA
jgi:hypothetical protein